MNSPNKQELNQLPNIYIIRKEERVQIECRKEATPKLLKSQVWIQKISMISIIVLFIWLLLITIILSIKIDDISKNNNSIAQQNEALSVKYDHLFEIYTNLNQKISDFMKPLDHLTQGQLALNIQNVIDKIQIIEKQVYNSNLDITNLKNDLSNQNIEITKANVSISYSNLKIEIIEKQLYNSNLDIINLKNDFFNQNIEITKANTSISDLKQQDVSFNEQIRTYDSQLSILDNKVLELGKNNNTLNLRIEIIEKQIYNSNLDITNFKNNLSNQNIEITKANVSISSLKLKIEIIEKQVNNYILDITNLKNDLSNQNIEISKTNTSISALKQQDANFNEKIRTYDSQLSILDNKVLELGKNNNTLNLRIEIIEKQIYNSNLDITNFKNDLSNQKIEITKANASISDLKQQDVNLNDKIKTYDTQLSILEIKILEVGKNKLKTFFYGPYQLNKELNWNFVTKVYYKNIFPISTTIIVEERSILTMTVNAHMRSNSGHCHLGFQINKQTVGSNLGDGKQHFNTYLYLSNGWQTVNFVQNKVVEPGTHLIELIVISYGNLEDTTIDLNAATYTIVQQSISS